MRRFYPSVLTVLIFMGLLSVSATAQEPAKQDSAHSAKASASAIAADGDQGPVTVKTSSDSKKSDNTDPILGVPPLPKGKTTLVGGRIAHIDGVHNRLAVKVFDGGKWNIAFDERTHFYRDGAETTFANIKKGDRVYVDTMLDGHEIFARNVHVVTHTGPAPASGQVMAVNNGMMTIHDDLSAQPVRFRVDGNTQITRNGSSASEGALREGTLVAVHFSPDTPNRGVAREVKILAEPGQEVTFYGKVMNVDLSSRQFAVANNSDNKTYDIAMDENYKVPGNLTVGSEVSVAAVFDGGGYKARSISVKQ